jgi:hypothetical protein
VLQLDNKTPFTTTLTLFPDEHGVDTLYVVVLARFTFHGGLRVADDQRPLRGADVFHGDPQTSSLRYPGELHLCKPGTDILVLGEAASAGRPVDVLDVGLRVGSRLDKHIRVTGDRTWAPEGERLTSRPEPFVRMPLQWERARGGPLRGGDAVDPQNPVGTGHGDRPPNLEDPARPMQGRRDMPPPVGFGPLAPTWAPRRDHVGTYDDRWRTTRAPYLPADFDPRFFHTAPTDQILTTPLRGGEPIELRNFWPTPNLRTHVPTCQLSAEAQVACKSEPISLHLETLLLEPGEHRMELLWRGALSCDKRMIQVDRIDIRMQRLDLGAAA